MHPGTDSTIVRAVEQAHRENRTSDEYELLLRKAELLSLPLPQRVEALIRAAALAEKLGRPQEAAVLAKRALEMAVAHGDAAGRINALSELGVQARTGGDFERSETLLREAAALAAEMGDKRLIARARGNLAVTLRRAGVPDRAFDESNAAARLYRDLGDLSGANRMLHLQSQIQQDQGLLVEARATLEEVIGLDAITGDVAGRARSLGNLSLLLQQMGDPSAAAERLDQAIALFRATGSRIDVIRARGNLGLVRRAMGDFAAALQCFEQSAAEATELGLHTELAHALSGEAATLAMCERWHEAEDCVNAAGTSGDYRLAHANLLTRARIALHHSDAPAALAHLREAVAIAREADNPLCLAQAHRLEAQVLLGMHDPEAARKAILQALEELEQGGQVDGIENLICSAVAAGIEQARGVSDEACTLAQAATEMADRHRQNRDPEVMRAISDLKDLAGGT